MKKITSLLLAVLMLFGVVTPSGTTAFAAGGAENYPLNSIVIKIEDIVTHQMLGGARFEIYYSNDQMSGGYGTLVATVDSDGSGVIVISGIPSGYYIVRQTVPPNNYHLSINNEQHCFIKADGTSVEELVFSNYRYGGLAVILNDKDTGKPVGGATFSVTDVNNKAVGNHADGIYTTDSRGEFFLENLPAGDYKITQLTAAQGYALDSLPSTRTVRLQHTNADQSVFMAQFSNSPLGTLLVRLKDSISKEPLTGAVFNVKLSGGEDLGEFTTGVNGSFTLPKIARGTYIISQVSAPSGYLLATNTKTQYVNYVNTYAVDFENQPKSGLYVTKYDKDTKAPLKDAKFQVYQNSTLIGTYTTNADGVFFIPDLNPGWYTISEYAAPQGYILDDTPKSVQVIAETLHRIEFDNSKLASLQIIKTNEFSGDPLSGAKFRVTTQNGEFVADVTTDGSGKAVIPALEPGWYVISETKAPTGYLITEAARTVEVKSTVPTVVTITNRAENNLQIVKLDFFTRTPLAGATFKVEHANGANVGTFNTDSAGKILIGNLSEGAYVVSEIKAPDGYQLDSEPQTIVIEGGKLHSVEFLDKPLTAIEIVKTDSVSKLPLAGATFKVERPNGEVIGTYKTDASGKAIVSNLESGTYIVSETIAPDGYILHETPKTVTVTSGKVTTVEFTNKPYSGIQILKTDSVTHNPLANATFKVVRPSGELIGTYKTDVSGKAIVPDLAEGTYIVSETIAPSGYVLNETPQTVTVTANKATIVEFANDPYGSLVIKKICEITEQPLKGARFTVRYQGGDIVGEDYTTGADGSVTLLNIKPGWYVISETRAPEGYMLDITAKTIEVKPQIPTTVTYTNRPYSGIQIIKTDSTTNAPLQGAVFTVQRADGVKVGDKYTTDIGGKIIVPDLPEGVYIITEVQAPADYVLDALPQTVEVKSGRLTIAEFTNTPYPYLHIKKVDATTGQLVAGAQFTVAKTSGEVIANITSLASGSVSIKVAPGVYVITEVKAPVGYELNDPVQTVEVKKDGSTIYYNGGGVVNGNTVTFANRPLNTIEIVKLDAVTKNPLSNAMFTVDKADGERIGSYRTDSSGKALVTGITEGTYVISETAAPTGYILNESPKSVNVSGGKLVSVEFLNKPLSGIQIIKMDAVTHQPLQGAAFTVTKANGERIGTFKTETDGKVLVPDLDEGVYVVGEITAPDGYQLDETPKNVTVKSGQLATVEFVNKPFSGIQIIKTDAVSHAPLSGATFEVKCANGETVGTYKTDVSGKAVISGLSEGTYIVSETIAPDNYILDNTPQTVTVKTGKLTTVEFVNKPFSGIEIRKVDAVNGNPLAGAVFEVRKQNGEYVTEVTTDIGGKASVANAEPGWYTLTETKAPQGYVIDGAAKTVEVKSGAPTVVTFSNKPLSGIQVVKLDAETNAPLSSATFLVERDNGERIGTYKTDATGKFIVSDLTEGTYIVSETAAPDGYVLSDAPKTVIVKSGKITTVEFTNKPLSGLKIIKLNSATRQPIAGVEFTVTKMSGETVTNEFSGTTFKTDKTGQIYIPGLADGHYIVTETKSATGYILDGEPKTVTVQSGKTAVLEVLNTPMSGLLIVKTDKNTGKPLQGVVFDVKRADGSFVAGSILDGNQPGTKNNSPNKTTSPNGDVTGSYTTDANGRILINGLDAGQYTVTERKALDGYELDTEVHNVTVVPGQLVTLQLTNTPKAGLRVIKIDSVTKKPIYGVEFMLFDAGNKVVGTYTTDNNGVIDFPTDIPAGRYTIRETRAAAGYYLDEIPKTVEFTAGKVTEIRWENTPCMAQIQITKKSGDDNEVNGLPAGTPLAGAVFEAYDWKTGNLVDRFVSGNDGRAVSKALPLGRYVVKEVQAPQWYKISDRELDITLEFATQIVKMEYLNYSANTGVSIKKTGNSEAMSGDVMPYTIRELKNTSTVPLTDFYWRDVLPVDAVRLTKIVTGTFNQSLKYKIIATTNKGDTKVIADNLSTTKNNVIDCSNASLGLRSDEFVTSVTFVFGTVKAGFCLVEQPQIFVKVQPNLPNGYQFANKCDIGGKYGKEWVAGNSTCLTTIYAVPGKLPRTGY